MNATNRPLSLAGAPRWSERFDCAAGTRKALPFVRAWHNPTASELIGAGAAAIVIIGAVAFFGLITALGKWRMLWSTWSTGLDHKKRTQA